MKLYLNQFRSTNMSDKVKRRSQKEKANKEENKRRIKRKTNKTKEKGWDNGMCILPPFGNLTYNQKVLVYKI